jgi:enoyl-CoA hydratase/carnithine racemase
LFLTAGRVGGREALEMGLVDYLSDSPLELALEVARAVRSLKHVAKL